MNGKITFVGAGPGAVDLITLRGAAALDEAGRLRRFTGQ